MEHKCSMGKIVWKAKNLRKCYKNDYRLSSAGKYTEIKQATKDIYILYQATKPAVMVECGFLSNAAEADKLTDEEYQDQIAFSICTALMNCLADQS